ncbi:MAG: hypothetical protein Q7T44_17815 [Parvibaculum sp.]|nr:hypothetical protein [Parvibaculum sp.]
MKNNHSSPHETTACSVTLRSPNNVFEADNKHYVTVFIVATPAGGEPQVLEPDKCEGWAWFEWETLPEPLFAPLATLYNHGYLSKWKTTHTNDRTTS